VATFITPETKAADYDLVELARAGDRSAFGLLYDRYRRMVHGILLSHVRWADAEDLMQDVFVLAIRQLPSLREASAFGGWLGAIARNLAIDFQRRQVPLVEATERNCGGIGQGPPAMVMHAVRSLPEAYRETLILRLVEGMTGPEIAARTGLTPDSVRVNLCRGMKLLRAQLGDETQHV
jgi:RNA polymerase sigma-70 factor (ECF subfamily)